MQYIFLCMIHVRIKRVLHGRDEFEGYRNLRGCYVGRDDIDSTKRQYIQDMAI